jgi:hypothetical protein
MPKSLAGWPRAVVRPKPDPLSTVNSFAQITAIGSIIEPVAPRIFSGSATNWSS